MAETSSGFKRSGGVLKSKSPIAGNGIQDELELLFAEVATFAKHLKTIARRIHRQDALPSGGRSILQCLDKHGPQTVPQLARARSSSRQHVQVLVNGLEVAGHVEFAPNPAHKRSDLIRLTEQGKGLLGTATERETNYLAPLLSHASEAELLSTAELLKKMRVSLAGQNREGAEVIAKAKPHRLARPRKAQDPGGQRKVARSTAEPVPGETSPAVAEEAEFPVSLL